MGLFGALSTSVAGLSAQSYALENISGNIANSQTTGFKRIDTSFLDLIPNVGVTTQLAGSVQAHSRETNTVRGDIAPASVATFMAISGDGFFTVQKPSSFNGNNPIFAGVDNFTRRGDFSLDKNGFLVNGAGYYLEGLAINPVTGNPTGSVPQVLSFASAFVPAQPTTVVQYQANVPRVPFTSNRNPTIPGSELLIPGPGPGTDLPGSAANNVVGSDVPAFIARSMNGGAITVFDVTGQQVNLQMRWAKTANAAAGPPPVPDSWNLYYQVDSKAVGGTVAWQQAGPAFTFTNGTMAPPVVSVPLGTPTIDGVALGPTPVTISIGNGGLTQFADPNGTVHVTKLNQDGFQAGSLQTVAVSSTGRVVGQFSNGRNIDLAEISVATFTGANFLKRQDGGAFVPTSESGSALFGNGGSVQGSALEGSNADIADEFTKLIVTQQAYSANTKVITTANSMAQDLLNVIR